MKDLELDTDSLSIAAEIGGLAVSFYTFQAILPRPVSKVN